MRIAILDNSGVVVNVTEDRGFEFENGVIVKPKQYAGLTVTEATGHGPGDVVVNGELQKRVVEQKLSEVDELRAELAELKATLRGDK